ncbi:MAG: ferrochelatase [Acidimicrobiales bacterium]
MDEPRPPDCVLVVSFGGPEGPDDVLPFLEHVVAGRGVPRSRLEKVAEQYGRFGGRSPINDQNRALVTALEDLVDLPVALGNRHWHPFLAETLEELAADGRSHALAFVTSAYAGPSSCRAYRVGLAEARAAVGPAAPLVTKLPHYWDRPGFLGPVADGLVAALAELPAGSAVAFTAHSVPVAQAEAPQLGGGYVAQLTEAGRRVAGLVGAGRFDLVFQSRSGSPHQPWLEPDVNDHLRALAAEGVPGVAVCPIGFTSDHMEVRYDLDTQARATAAGLGLAFRRSPTAGADPRFVAMAADLVAEAIAAGAPPDTEAACRPGCCQVGPPG